MLIGFRTLGESSVAILEIELSVYRIQVTSTVFNVLLLTA